MNYGKVMLICLILCMAIHESNTWGIIDSLTSNMKAIGEKVKTVAQSAMDTMKTGIQSASGNITSGAQSAFDNMRNKTKSVYYSSKDWGKALLRNTRNVKAQPAEGNKKKGFKMVDIRNVASRKVGRKMVDMRQKSKKKAKKSKKQQEVAASS